MNLFETLWGGIEWLDHGSGWLEALLYASLLLLVLGVLIRKFSR